MNVRLGADDTVGRDGRLGGHDDRRAPGGSVSSCRSAHSSLSWSLAWRMSQCGIRPEGFLSLLASIASQRKCCQHQVESQRGPCRPTWRRRCRGGSRAWSSAGSYMLGSVCASRPCMAATALSCSVFAIRAGSSSNNGRPVETDYPQRAIARNIADAGLGVD